MLLTFFTLLALQTPPPEVRIRSGVYAPQPLTIVVQSSLVELGATVRDRRGAFAGGLPASDFEVLDNGVAQPIKAFSEQTFAERKSSAASSPIPTGDHKTPSAQPARAIALFFDDTHLEINSLQKSKEGAEKLIATGLLAGDRVGIFTASGTVTQEFTGDSSVLLTALAEVRPHLHAGIRGMGDCPTLTPYEAYVIAFHLDPEIKQRKVGEVCACCNECCPTAPLHVQDTAESMWSMFKHHSSDVLRVLDIVVRHLAAAPGNRILILVSPGFATPDMESQSNAILETALRYRIVINALNAEGLVAGFNPRAIGLRQQLLSEFMTNVADGTGGQFIQNSNDFAGNIRALATPPPVSYLIGFTPAAEPDGKYHVLKVRLKSRPGYQVASRRGYFATVLSKPPETVQQRIDREVTSSGTLDETPATVQVAIQKPATIQVTVKVDATRLKFVMQDDRSTQQLTFVTLLQDAQGNLISGKQAVMDLSLTPAKLADFQSNGIKAVVTFTAPAGTYRVREIVREAVENHMAVSNTAVEIP